MNLLRLTAKAPLAGMIPGLPIAETSVIDSEGAARPLPHPLADVPCNLCGEAMNDLTQNTLSHLDKLIAFPTVSSESNMDLINYAANFFDDIGADVHLSHNPDGTKANLFATIGPRQNGGVVLSGHTDVVPVEGQDWTSDPFSAVHKDDRVIGRGACDMKGFIACALASAPAFQALELTRPLHIALTYDEEVGCLGAPVMLNALADLGIRPNVAIIGEPTGMQIIEGHKGCYEYTTQIRGLEGHGSLPDAGVNAVESAVRIIHELLETGETLRQRAPADSRFTPPWTTVSVGKIEGGIARNIIAKDCTFEWEIRPVQRSDSDLVWDRLHTLIDGSLLPEMQKRYECLHPNRNRGRSGRLRADERQRSDRLGSRADRWQHYRCGVLRY